MFKLIFPNKNWLPEKMAARKITQKILKIIAINPPMFQPLAGIYFKKNKSAVSFGGIFRLNLIPAPKIIFPLTVKFNT